MIGRPLKSREIGASPLHSKYEASLPQMKMTGNFLSLSYVIHSHVIISLVLREQRRTCVSGYCQQNTRVDTLGSFICFLG